MQPQTQRELTSLRRVISHRRLAHESAATACPLPNFFGSGRKARIFIVDDTVAFRQATSNLLSQERDLVSCGEADNNQDALRMLTTAMPDLVVTDLVHPGKNGIQLTEDILALLPATKVLVMSLAEDPFIVESALRAGAHGYFSKRDGAAQLVNAIRAVLAGQIFVSERIA